MNKKYRPDLGMKIVARAHVVKTRTPVSRLGPDQVKGLYDDFHTLWPLQEQHIEGVFTGYRTISQGTTGYRTDYDGEEVRAFFRAINFEAWLIVTDPRRKPLFVLPADVTEIDGIKLYETRFFSIESAGGKGILAVPDVMQKYDPETSNYLESIVSGGWKEIGWQEYMLSKSEV